MFTQHQIAFLADTKSYLGKSEQHDNDTELVLAISYFRYIKIQPDSES